MNRPSYWILLFTLGAGGAYAVIPRPARAPQSALSRQDGPIVVHRGSAPVPAAGAVLEGRVLDRLGWPVAGAGVALVDDHDHGDGDGEGKTRTDERGTFTLSVRSLMRHRVRIAAPDREPVVRWVHPRESAVVVMQDRLPWVEEKDPGPAPRGLLAGEGFLQRENGEGAAFGVVTVVETGVRVAADATGRYRIALPDGPATLLAYDGNGKVARSEPVYSVRKQGLVPLPDLVLEAGLALRGYLRDQAGRPSSGAALIVRGQGVLRVVQTDAAGGFAFTGLLSGAYVLEALPHRGALGFRRHIELQASVDRDLALETAKPLQIHVVGESAAPVAGVWVLAEEGEVRRALARTDAEGKATFEGMGAGPFAFDVREPETFAQREIVSFDEQLARLIVR